jgi:uncharacterized protein (DUF1778 family)
MRFDAMRDQIRIRISCDEKRAMEAARQAGQTLSDFLRTSANRSGQTGGCLTYVAAP